MDIHISHSNNHISNSSINDNSKQSFLSSYLFIHMHMLKCFFSFLFCTFSSCNCIYCTQYQLQVQLKFYDILFLANLQVYQCQTCIVLLAYCKGKAEIKLIPIAECICLIGQTFNVATISFYRHRSAIFLTNQNIC